MDNNVENPDSSEGTQQEPENTFPPVEPGYQPETPVNAEPSDQSDMPPLPQVPDREERLWATFCHLAALVGFTGIPFCLILGPLIIWLIKREESPFIDENGKKALNFQISMMIYMIASLSLVCLGPLVAVPLIALSVTDVIYTIIAAIKANNGEEVSYPISIGFIK